MEGKLDLDPDGKLVFRLSLVLFIGYSILTATVIDISARAAGSFFGLLGLSAIAALSVTLADGMEEKWSRFFQLLGISSLIVAVFGTAQLGFMLALG